MRVPAIWFGDDWYYPRFGPLWVSLSVATYFLAVNFGRILAGMGAGSAIVVAIYIAMLPSDTDSVIMALIHFPLIYWSYVGLAFMGDAWRDSESRIRFVRYSGELFILFSLFALGGMVLTGLTIGLFSLIGEDIGEWYFRNVIVLGVAGVPAIATYVYDIVLARRINIASVLSRVFAPLFLVMVVTYLAFTLFGGKDPFKASMRVLEKCGFELQDRYVRSFSKFGGRQLEVSRYAINRTRWLKQAATNA